MNITDKQWFLPLMVFFMGCVVRLVPELFAYPYPIGYDVINYYIPVTTNFADHWAQISSEFPLYVSFLHLTQIATGLTPYTTVVIFATVTFGFFAVSVFLIARKLLKVDSRYAFFVTAFVIFQIAVLRTTWDLHRDVFTLTMMLFVFVLIYRESEKNEPKSLDWKFILILILCVLTVSTARIVGSLFIVSLIIYSCIFKTKAVILCTILALSFFTIELFMNHNITSNIIHDTLSKTGNVSLVYSNFYNPKNLLYLFVVVDGLLVPTGIIGFVKLKNGILLKIPLLITAAASFSWIVFPFHDSLLADRWIILLGIVLSIFSAYGIYQLVLSIKIRPHRLSNLASTILPFSILGMFIMMGILYEILPNAREPFMLWYGVARSYTEHFVPPSMQFNSLELSDNNKIITAISWINKNTQPNAIIIGEKHWRGFMELYLHDHRTFRFSDDLPALASGLIKHRVDGPVYLIQYSDTRNNNSNIYSNNLFSINKIR
ncbi:MAG TPA: hypothetical protein VEH06_06635 [Candidatus Bathyarchaeia archaeon]|nr:hypothetical protein [Candidatus Bathyarchaeia archaeon]